MSALRPRLRALAVLVALCLSVGPASSALCPHADAETHAGHGEPQAARAVPAEAPPCHEMPAPEPEPDAAECVSPCCDAASAPAPPPPPASELPVTALLPALADAMTVSLAPAPDETRPPPRPPPDGAALKTVRLRV